jgi:hypothetical protein
VLVRCLLWVKSGRDDDAGMSALPPKADIRPRDQDVCFGPEADIDELFNIGGGTVIGANEAQVADDFLAAALVRGMVDAVDHRHVGKIKWAHAF